MCVCVWGLRQDFYCTELTAADLIAPDYERSAVFGIPHPQTTDVATLRALLQAPSLSAQADRRGMIDAAGTQLASGINAVQVSSTEPLLVQLPVINVDESLW